MNVRPARGGGSGLRCVRGELEVSERRRRTLGAAHAAREVIMGVRPEHFEDAALVEPGANAHGVTFAAHVEMLESLGSDKYAHFSLEGEPVSAAELTELAAEAGTSAVFGASQLVIRLPAVSAAT